MKYLALFISVFMFATQVNAKSIKEMNEIIKKPITITAKKSLLLDVIFNHSSHRGINCITCHHALTEKEGRYIKCSKCHANIGRSKENLSMFMASHANKSNHSCYRCHINLRKKSPEKYSRIFYNCRPCHANLK